MFPERIFGGAPVLIEGDARKRDGRPFDLSGYQVVLVVLDGQERKEVEGGILNAPEGKFQLTLSKEFTQALKSDKIQYELVIRNANSEYVCDQGEMDVRDRL